MEELVSIITPSYQQGRYLEETIRSVLEQDYPNIEYTVMDGGSKDETVSILKKYSDRLAFWTSEPDKGQTDAINKGFARAKGQILAWINSDDTYNPGAVRQAVTYLREHPEMAEEIESKVRAALGVGGGAVVVAAAEDDAE